MSKQQEEGLATVKYNLSRFDILEPDRMGFTKWLAAVDEKLQKMFAISLDEIIKDKLLPKQFQNGREDIYFWDVYKLRSDPPMKPENAAKYISRTVLGIKYESASSTSEYREYLSEIFKHQVAINKAGTLDGVDPELAKVMVISGLKDGDMNDDKVKVSRATWKAVDLKPSQNTMILETALSLVLLMIDKDEKGGDLGALVSSDGYIMDGHHRWASNVLLQGKEATLSGYKASLKGEKLLPVLNVLTKGYFGVNTGNPSTGTFSNFTVSNVRKVLEGWAKDGVAGKRAKTPEMVQELLAKEFGSVEAGIDAVSKNVELITKTTPAWSPKREQMPVIDQVRVKAAAEKLRSGEIDHVAPFAESFADTLYPRTELKSADKLKSKMATFVEGYKGIRANE